MKNEILEKLWKTKDTLAEEYEYKIDKLAAHLKVKEKDNNYNTVDLSKDKMRE